MRPGNVTARFVTARGSGVDARVPGMGVDARTRHGSSRKIFKLWGSQSWRIGWDTISNNPPKRADAC
jgi:hypothetical protein